MENSEETMCRLCHNVIDNGNVIVVEETTLRLLNLNVKEDIKPVVCTACSMRLFEAYHFKTTCIDTEDNICSHINTENIAPLDLRDIYLKINDREYLGTIMEDERICRLCMHIVTSGFTSVENVKTDMIQICIPEINFSYTKEPIICATCLYSLITHSSFLKSCLGVEQQIKNFNNCKESSSCIKVEEINIKSEDNNDSTMCISMDNITRPKASSDNQTYTCDTCSFETKEIGTFKLHLLRHKYPEVQLHRCESCNYKSAWKSALVRHQLRHKSTSEVRMFDCGTCEYKTKYKCNLEKHRLKHKDTSEVQMHKCDTCDYETKVKGNLKLHMLCHKDLSEMQLYKCDKCDYKGKFKHHLVQHQQARKHF